MNYRIIVIIDGEVCIVFVYPDAVPGKKGIISQLNSFGKKFNALNPDLLFCMKTFDNAFNEIVVIKGPDIIDDIGIQFFEALVNVEEVLKYNF